MFCRLTELQSYQRTNMAAATATATATLTSGITNKLSFVFLI